MVYPTPGAESGTAPEAATLPGTALDCAAAGAAGVGTEGEEEEGRTLLEVRPRQQRWRSASNCLAKYTITWACPEDGFLRPCASKRPQQMRRQERAREGPVCAPEAQAA